MHQTKRAQHRPGMTCWVITEGHTGMENQCLGVAQAVGLEAELKRVRPESPWKYLPAQLWWRPLSGRGFSGDRLEPPWPDVIISCGRKGAALALAVNRENHGRTFTVHVQDPQLNPRKFDLLLVPRHDRLRGDNVFVTRGATHHLTPEMLEAAGRRFAPQLAHLPRPLLAVLIGGSNRCYRITPEIIASLAERLIALSRRYGAGLLITPSRRTGAENEAALRRLLADVPAVIWDGRGENPYCAYLALADAIAVTADSVSMVSEACSTGKPVYVIDLEGGDEKFGRFHAALREEGVTRPFTGELDRWDYDALDDTRLAAQEILRRLGGRGRAIRQPDQEKIGKCHSA